MEKRRLEKADCIKIAICGFLMTLCLIATLYFHFVLMTKVVFTHLFYVPVILAGLWWQRKGIAVALFLAVFLLLVSHIPLENPDWAGMARAFMLVVIGTVVGILSEKKKILENKLIAYNKRLEERVAERTNDLMEAQEKQRAILDGIGDAVIVLDKDLNITWANEIAADLYGAVVGIRCHEGLKGLKEPCSNCIARKTFTNGVAKSSEEEGISKDGRCINFIVSCSPVRGADKKILAVVKVLHNITELKWAKNHLKYLKSILESIKDVNRLIAREKDKCILLNRVCEMLTTAREYRMAWIGLIESGHGKVVPAALNGFEDGYLESVKTTWNDNDSETGKGPTGTAIKTKKPCVMQDIVNDPEYSLWVEETKKRGYLSSIALPLFVENKVYGALNIYSSTKDVFDSDEICLLKEIAASLSFGLSTIETEEKRRDADEKLLISLQEKELLLKEILHRVKNNFQVISSLLNLTELRTRDQEALSLLTDARARIHTMALVHSQLYRSERFDKIDMGNNIRKLVDYLSSVYTDGKSITSVVEIADTYLPITQAIPCALALNEIISNVFKHAFKQGQKGTVTISMQSSDEGMISATIKDDGISVPREIDIYKTDSLGLKLIRNLVQKQLKGRMQVKRNKGTEFIIEFKREAADV